MKSAAHYRLWSRLCTIDMKKSTGLDELHSKILKRIAQFIATPLTVILKMSLDPGELPMDWKGAIVTPIHKTGLWLPPSNCRPVNLISVVVKIRKRITERAIVTSMEINNLWNNEQHGFKKGLSCTTNLLIVRNLWTKALDSGKSVDVTYVDFSKAFDRVPKNIFPLKLENIWVTIPLVKRIKEFLVGLKQEVRINSQRPSWKPTISGVLQGSVPVSLFFTLYVSKLLSTS